MPPAKKYLSLLFFALCLITTTIPASAQQSWCGIQTLYFQHNASTSPVGYEELINYPSGNPQEDESVTITSASGTVWFDSYITPEGALVDTTELRKGLRRYRMFHYVNSASGTTTANYSVFIRSSNGTESYVYSATSDDINDLSPTEYLTSYVKAADSPISPSDRIVIKVGAMTTHPSPITVHFVYQGTTNTSHVESGFFVCREAGDASTFSVALPDNDLPVDPLSPCIAIGAGIVLLTRRKNNG